MQHLIKAPSISNRNQSLRSTSLAYSAATCVSWVKLPGPGTCTNEIPSVKPSWQACQKSIQQQSQLSVHWKYFKT